MFNFETPNILRRRRNEAERRERIFNHKLRTIGVDTGGLDQQVEEKKKQKEAEDAERNVHDAEVSNYNRRAQRLYNHQVRERHAMERAMVNYRYQYQQPQSQRDFDLNDPDRHRNTRPADARMLIPGLVGEDPDSNQRRQRQREQMREWIYQQQTERQEEKHREQLEELQLDQSTIDKNNRAMQLELMEVEQRRAAKVAAAEFNGAMMQERRRQERIREEEEGGYTGAKSNTSRLGPPGFIPGTDLREPPESLQQVTQFQKYQMEEKKMLEMERRKENDQHDRFLLDTLRSAKLLERKQALLNKQLRRQQDSVNNQIAESQRRKPDLKQGHIDESFFSQFNTCSR